MDNRDALRKRHVDRVVMAVFDGLRADMVSETLTPNIMRVARRGVWQRTSRTVFPSVTRVATSSIATGAVPALHGVVGNAFHFPQALPDRILDTGKAEHIRAADGATNARFVDVDTFADVIGRNGGHVSVVHTGSAGSTYCINPRAAQLGHWTFSINGADCTMTPGAVVETVAQLGPLPATELPKLAAQTYAARVMTDIVLPRKPDVALVWFSEPDTSYHYLEIGSDGALAAIRNADAALGSILDCIEAMGDSDRVAVIVASDHGQISTSAAIALFDEARAAGIKVAPRNELIGASIIGSGGSSGEFRFPTGDREAMARTARWLMDHEQVSHVLTRGVDGVHGEVEGTLALEAVGQGHARSGDMMFILKSDLTKDKYGLTGLGLLMPGDVHPGGGYHGGLNPVELNSVLIVAGGPMPADVVSREPAGVIDIAPTILDLLGLEKPATMMGRSLAQPIALEPVHRRFEAGAGDFAQSVSVIDIGAARYIQHGGQDGADALSAE